MEAVYTEESGTPENADYVHLQAVEQVVHAMGEGAIEVNVARLLFPLLLLDLHWA